MKKNIFKISITSNSECQANCLERKLNKIAKELDVRVSLAPLPKSRRKFVVIKSPHVHKTSREQYSIIIFKKLLLAKGENAAMLCSALLKMKSAPVSLRIISCLS